MRSRRKKEIRFWVKSFCWSERFFFVRWHGEKGQKDTKTEKYVLKNIFLTCFSYCFLDFSYLFLYVELYGVKGVRPEVM